LAFGCVAYDQDVLSVVEDLTPPADFSLPNSDGMPPKCSRQQNSAPQCRDPVEWVKTAAKTCCDLLGQQLTLAQFDRPCWGDGAVWLRPGAVRVLSVVGANSDHCL
jgi:hypothetical protein